MIWSLESGERDLPNGDIGFRVNDLKCGFRIRVKDLKMRYQVRVKEFLIFNNSNVMISRSFIVQNPGSFAQNYRKIVLKSPEFRQTYAKILRTPQSRAAPRSPAGSPDWNSRPPNMLSSPCQPLAASRERLT